MIRDQFTRLKDKISRQQLWQMRHRAAGKCTKCDLKITAGSKNFCAYHQDYSRRKNFILNRIKTGKSLKAPKWSRNK